MDERFVRIWEEWERCREEGVPFLKILREAPTVDLVAALAGAASADAMAANAIATELLNRQRRAPYLGAFLVSLTVAVMIYLLDWIYTGTPLFLEGGARAYILEGFSLTVAVFSFFMYRMWRGGHAGLRARLARDRSF